MSVSVLPIPLTDPGDSVPARGSTASRPEDRSAFEESYRKDRPQTPEKTAAANTPQAGNAHTPSAATEKADAGSYPEPDLKVTTPKAEQSIDPSTTLFADSVIADAPTTLSSTPEAPTQVAKAVAPAPSDTPLLAAISITAAESAESLSATSNTTAIAQTVAGIGKAAAPGLVAAPAGAAPAIIRTPTTSSADGEPELPAAPGAGAAAAALVKPGAPAQSGPAVVGEPLAAVNAGPAPQAEAESPQRQSSTTQRAEDFIPLSPTTNQNKAATNTALVTASQATPALGVETTTTPLTTQISAEPGPLSRTHATTPPSAPHLAQPVADPVRQVADAIRVHRQDQTISVRLDPPDLGSVTIDLSFDKNARLVAAVVAADTADTTSLLRRQLDSLQRELASAGFEGVSVDIGQQKSEKSVGDRWEWWSRSGAADMTSASPSVPASTPVNIISIDRIDARF